jgi:hypothetical protein
MRLVKTASCNAAMLMALILAFSGPANAQTPVYRPGQTIKITVTFEGKDAGRIEEVSADLRTSETHENQPAFIVDLPSQGSHPTTPNTFEISVKIPENATSGVYKIVWFQCIIRDLRINFVYESPAPSLTYKIENPNHIEKPTIKEVH